MTSMDKMGMIIAVAIVVAAVGFTMTGGSGAPSDIPVVVAPVMEQAKDIKKDIEPAIEKIKEVAKESKEVLEKTKATTEKGMKMAEELASAKASVRLVSIPEGTSVPGCEKNDLCYDPPHVIVFEDAEVTWKNDDTAAHTVTSGTASGGPDGKFDSSLMVSGSTFSQKFEEKGKYPYFCMVHP
ncbi:MAG: plastocyanin/azurin family copper-binding protein [Nitrosopumilus sp.]|nr:plastocyanin/azurin family copper-binding protein [Nitrosopumilus sp.]